MPSAVTSLNLGLTLVLAAIYLFFSNAAFLTVAATRPQPAMLASPLAITPTARPSAGQPFRWKAESPQRRARRTFQFSDPVIAPIPDSPVKRGTQSPATKPAQATESVRPPNRPSPPALRQKTRREVRRAGGQGVRWAIETKEGAKSRGSLLPRALLVAIRFQALPALVLVHLQTTFLFEIAHK